MTDHTPPPEITVTIGRVALPRTALVPAAELARAVERELTALLRRAPLPPATLAAGTAASRPLTVDLDTTVRVPGVTTTTAVARALARQAHHRLLHPTRSPRA
jgi:hypothetical protein